VKFALRMLRKNPTFTIIAVLTLALGIGANSAIFSVVHAVLLQPLPYKNPAELLYLSGLNRQNGATGVSMSYTKFTQIREQTRTLEPPAAFYVATFSLITGREPEAVSGIRISQNLFSLFGVSPILGRDFRAEEEVPGGDDVAIISDGFWHSHLGADPSALGRTMSVDGRSVTIVGILPANFHFPLQFPEPDIWIPGISDPAFLLPAQVRSGAGYLSLIARLRSGESLTSAKAELDTIDARYQNQFRGFVDSGKIGIAAQPLSESLVGPLRAGFAVLLAAVGFILLIACANVANLLLARATSRQREMALRKALGASGARLIRQLLSESLLLSLVGGAIGVVLATAMLPALRSFSPGSVPRLAETRLDATVLIFSVVLSIVTGVLFGLVPALQASAANLHETLKEGGRGSADGGHRGKFRNLLVVAEMAIALILMTGAGLLLQSFSRLMNVNPGFSPDNVMSFHVTLPPSHYGQPETQKHFYREFDERVKTIPGVESAGFTSYLPLSGGVRYVYFCAEGMVCQGIGKDPLIALRQVTPGYFATMRTPLLKGRVFTVRDLDSTPPIAVVNETVADRYWPGQDPIGKHIANSRDMIQREVVGVVADVKFTALDAVSSEEMYLPIEQVPASFATLIVRSQSNPESLVRAVRSKLAALDSTLPLSNISSLDTVVAQSVAQPRILSEFVGVFAAFALVLSAIGIYGVMAYSVAARSQEMGIRMSLGANPADILRLVVRQGMCLALIGVAIGLVTSLALTRLINTLLFNTSASNPLTFAVAAIALTATAAAACYIPARRATKVDPMVVLRYE
jgi:putative ABC transport system permease protein